MKELEAIYFPYASIKDMVFLKTALLYFDKIAVISSHYAVRDTGGEFAELLDDGELVQWIDGDDIAMYHGNILKDAVSTDLSDDGFLSLTRHPNRVWEIYGDKGLDVVEKLVKPIRERGRRVAVPYDQGESFLINMALIAATSGPKKLVPLTDREEHFSMLRYKLKRGAKGQLERLYSDSLEQGQIETLVSKIGRELVEASLPSPERMEDIPLQRIKDFRDQYKEDRDKLRDSIIREIENTLKEEGTVSPGRLQTRIQVLVSTQLRQLKYDRSAKSRILNGFKTVLGAAKELTGTLKSAFTGVPLAVALAPEALGAASHLVDFVDHEMTVLTKSDVAYLYRIGREFAQ